MFSDVPKVTQQLPAPDVIATLTRLCQLVMDRMAALGRPMAAKCKEADGDGFLFDNARGSPCIAAADALTRGGLGASQWLPVAPNSTARSTASPSSTRLCIAVAGSSIGKLALLPLGLSQASILCTLILNLLFTLPELLAGVPRSSLARHEVRKPRQRRAPIMARWL